MTKTIALAALLAFCMDSAHAQLVTFVRGPSADLSDSTIPPTFGGPLGGNLSLVASILATDLAKTGKPDIVVGVGLNPLIPAKQLPIRVLRATTGGAYTDVTRQLFGTGALPSAAGPRALYSADFNRDGKPDLLCACQGYDSSPPDGERNLLLLSTAGLTYDDRTSTTPTQTDYTHSAAIADINGDGILDIYVGNISGSHEIGPYLLLGRPDGTFQQIATGLPDSIRTMAEKYTTVTFLDVDNDGFPDLVLGAEGSSSHSSIVLFNDGTGDFTRRTRYVLPAGPFGNNFVALDIKLIDANRDGYWDLLITQTLFQPNYVGGSIQLLMNQRNGTFTDETVARLGAGATVMTGIGWNTTQVVDMNGDGWPDIVASTEFGFPGATALNYLWINNRDGTFTPVSASTLSPAPTTKLVATDADGDGMPDIVSVGFTGEGKIHFQTYLNRTPRTAPLDYTDMWWAGSAENGWGMSIQQHASGIQFNALYVYDAAGKPIWYVMPGGTWSNGFKTFSGPIYVPTGSPLNNFNASQIVVGASPGTVSITFDTINTATLSYTINGISGTKAISRQLFGTPDFRYASVVDHSGTPGYIYPLMTSDMWWGGPSQSGWGINVVQQYRKVFSVWYTYGGDNRATWFVLPDGSWTGNTYSGTLYATTGSQWLGANYNPGQLAATPVGTMSFGFANANNATLSYNFTAGPFSGTNQTKNIVRQAY